MAKITDLGVGELDDAFHLAIFLCDDALDRVIGRALIECHILLADHDQKAIERFLKLRLETAFHEIEMSHMGKERYDAMMERMLDRHRSPRRPQ